MSIINKLRKNSLLEEADVLATSKFFTEKDMVQTPVPILNVALSGSVDGGLTPGITIFAGPSKNFKSGLCLFLAKTYMDKYPDAALIYYDSEFGTPKSFWESFGIDQDRVLHSPIKTLENLKFDLIKQLNEIERGERVIVVIDSLGNVPSKKELEATLNQDDTKDMTRQQETKAIFRQAAQFLNDKDIPMLVVSHTYKTMEKFAKDVVSGGTGQYYNADNVFIMGRQQDAEKVDGKKEIQGYHFVLNVDKSRYVKEKSKIFFSVSFDTGIDKYSGLLELGLESGVVTQEGRSYVLDKQQYTKNQLDKFFFDTLLGDKNFREFVKTKYSLTTNAIMSDSEIKIYDEKIREAINGK